MAKPGYKPGYQVQEWWMFLSAQGGGWLRLHFLMRKWTSLGSVEPESCPGLWCHILIYHSCFHWSFSTCTLYLFFHIFQINKDPWYVTGTVSRSPANGARNQGDCCGENYIYGQSYFISTFEWSRTLLLYNFCASVSSSVERVACHIYRYEEKLLELSEVTNCISTEPK